MNLLEFSNHRQTCPFCDQKLFTSFRPLSGKRPQQRYEGGRWVCIFSLNDYDRTSGSKKYKVGYSFGLKDNSFEVVFYEAKEELIKIEEKVPLFLLKRFVGLHRNLRKFRFFRECKATECRRYLYTSNDFEIDLRHKVVPAPEIWMEGLGLIHHTAGGSHKIFRLYNTYGEQRSMVYIQKNFGLRDAQVVGRPEKTVGELELPIIPIVSIADTTRRINDLLIFL